MRLYKKFYVSEKAANRTTSPDDVYNSLKGIANADQESFWLIGYNMQNIEIYRECLFLGGVGVCTVDPKIVFRRLLLNQCSHFTVVHNHPGGENEPSEADILVTKKLNLGADSLDMRMLDHLIISDAGYFSFKKHGML